MLALDVTINRKTEDTVTWSGSQHYFTKTKGAFFQLLCFNQLGSQFRTKINASYEIQIKLYDPSRWYQISSLKKPQWIENTALTLHSKTSGGIQNPEKVSVPVAVLHIWTGTVTHHSMSGTQLYAEMSVTPAHWKPSWLQKSMRFLYF